MKATELQLKQSSVTINTSEVGGTTNLVSSQYSSGSSSSGNRYGVTQGQERSAFGSYGNA